MPAEWEHHDATWIAWPHEESDWPHKLETVDWVYAEIAGSLCSSEHVHIICKDGTHKARAKFCLDMHRVPENGYSLHILPTDRSWLRDSAPTAVFTGEALEWIQWKFNAWAKYGNFLQDANVPSLVSRVSRHPIVQAVRPDTREPFVLEGGAIETDGEGTLLVTEDCLLSVVQERNPGLTREGYEEAFAEYLGVTKTIWLTGSCEGDDTHGHIDDVARFVSPGHVALYFQEDKQNPGYEKCVQNLEILAHATDAAGRKLKISKLPAPREMFFGDEQLPASYANFYIGNSVVLVPTFNDENDFTALQIIRDAFPGRKVRGISSVDLVLGFGTLHCLSQQQPGL